MTRSLYPTATTKYPITPISATSPAFSTGSEVGIFVAIIIALVAIGAAYKFRDPIKRVVWRNNTIPGWDSTRLSDLEDNGFSSDRSILMSIEQ